MNTYLIFDIVVALVLLFGLYKGVSNGIIKELAFFAAIILGIYVSKLVSPDVAEWVMGFSGWDYDVCLIVAYGILFFAVAFGLHFVASLITKALRQISLGWLNKLLGAVFGVLKFGLIISVLLNLLITVNLHEGFAANTYTFTPIAAVLDGVLDFADEVQQMM